MKLFSYVMSILIVSSLKLYCPPLFHAQHIVSTRDAYFHINKNDPVKTAQWNNDFDIHYNATPLNPLPLDYQRALTDPRSPINPNQDTLEKLAVTNEESARARYMHNRTFKQNYVPGGVRVHSD